MDYSATTAHILGTSTGSVWGQTYHEKNLFIALEVINQDESVEVAVVGKAVLMKLITSITEARPLHLAELTQIIEQSLTGFPHQISAVVGFLVNDVLFIVMANQGSVYLSRGGRVASILEDGGSVSGRVKPNDVFFFFSRAFHTIVSLSTLQAIHTLSLDEIGERLALSLHREGMAGASGIIIQIKEQKEVELDLSPPSQVRKISLAPLFQVLPRLFTRLRLSRRLQVDWSYRKKVALVALAITSGIFLLSIIFGLRRHQLSQSYTTAQVRYEQAKLKLEEGKALVDINSERARSVLSEAKADANAYKTQVSAAKGDTKKAQLLLSEIEKAQQEAAKIYRLTEVPLFYDLTLVKNGAKGTDMALYQSNLIVLDSTQGSVYQIATNTKRGEVAAGGEQITNPKRVALFGDTAYILANQGIIVVNTRSKERTNPIKNDSSWGEISAIDAFAGNIYMIDSTHNSLWKYQATDLGFGEKITYIPDDQSHHFSTKTSLAIDGAVWTMTGERLVKFLQGKPDTSISLKGLDSPFSGDVLIYTNESNTYLYFLDRGNKRIVVTDKSGGYQSQYVWEGLGSVSKIVVSNEPKKILLLSDNKIYGIDLR